MCQRHRKPMTKVGPCIGLSLPQTSLRLVGASATVESGGGQLGNVVCISCPPAWLVPSLREDFATHPPAVPGGEGSENAVLVTAALWAATWLPGIAKSVP